MEGHVTACDKKLRVYRRIQLLASLCNEIQQKIIVPAVIAGTITSVGFGLPILVLTPRTSENVALLVTVFAIVLSTMSFMIFCLGGFVDVYKESKISLEIVRSNIWHLSVRKNREWAMRVLWSCGLIKIKFGGNNFVEELTPLNCLSFATQLAVQLLLLKRSSI